MADNIETHAEQEVHAKESGYRILQSWHIYLMIAVMLVGFGVTWGTTTSAITTLENRVTKTEVNINEMQKELPTQAVLVSKIETLTKQVDVLSDKLDRILMNTYGQKGVRK
jgi:ABC-type proline/glycine betaine transport system permease subunit